MNGMLNTHLGKYIKMIDIEDLNRRFINEKNINERRTNKISKMKRNKRNDERNDERKQTKMSTNIQKCC